MASVELDKKVTLELREGEEVFFSHKVNHYTSLLSGGIYSFAITNQRIAIVPYKAGKELITINFEDIRYARITKAGDMNTQAYFKVYLKEKTKLLGFIPVQAAKKFLLQGKALEQLALLGKDTLREMKNVAAGMAQALEYQGKANAIENNNQIYDKNAAKNEAWAKTAGYWGGFTEKATEKIGGGKKPNPVERAQFLVDTINEIVVLVSGETRYLRYLLRKK